LALDAVSEALLDYGLPWEFARLKPYWLDPAT
jgi:hypothetical protein